MMQVHGKVGLAEDECPRFWVRKREFCGVKKLARQPKSPPAGRAAVLGVAADRMPDRPEVHADLVRAAGLEPYPQQRRTRECLLDLEVGDRLARAVGTGRVD